MFFTMTEEEIVKLMVSQGFSPKTAAQEAAKFMKYRERIVGPKQIWSDDDEQKPQEGQPEAATTHRKFADEVARKEGE